MSAMKVIFFGSGAFGLPTLKALAREHRVLGIVSQPDRPAGRGGQLTPTPIVEFAEREMRGVPILRPEDVNVPAVVSEIRELGAEAAVVIAFGQKLTPEVLPGAGRAINLHASLLPRWRGAAPINAAILAGDTVTGNSVITIAPRMDAGLVLAQSRLEINPLETAGELHDRLSEQGPGLIMSVLSHIQSGSAGGHQQDEALVTKARKLSKKDAWVDFHGSAEECRRRVHGLNPWPGVVVRFREDPLKLLRVRALPKPGRGEPGTITSATEGFVACGDGLVQLLEVQPAGGKRLAWPEFARGKRVSDGELLMGGAQP